MPVDTNQLLALVSYGPKIGWSANVGAFPDIELRFNIPIDSTQLADPATLNQYFLLFRMDGEEAVPLTLKTWDNQNRILTLTPQSGLVPGAVYQVTVRKELKTAQGRGMVQDRFWVFQVDPSALGIPALAQPGDATAFAQTPALEFLGVAIPSGTVRYEVQLDTNWQFGLNLVWTTTYTVSGSAASGYQSVMIGTPLAAGTTYFWRARALTDSLSGDWSEIRSFWVGTAMQTGPDTILSFHDDETFRLVSLTPENGAAHQRVWPSIVATFNQAIDPASVTSGSFQVWASPVDGRVSVGSSAVPGLYTVVGPQVLFSPTAATPAVNTRYTLVLTTSLASTGAGSLPEETQSYFSGPYTPIYGGVINVRSELGGFIDEVSDDEIIFQLWQASLHVHELLITRVYRLRATVQFTELINYQPPAVTWGMGRYAELAAAWALLNNYYYDVGHQAGRRAVLATFEYEVDVKLLAELRARMKELQEERDQIAARFLYEVVVPRTTRKSTFYVPDPLVNPGAVDYSLVDRPHWGRRDPYRQTRGEHTRDETNLDRDRKI